LGGGGAAPRSHPLAMSSHFGYERTRFGNGPLSSPGRRFRAQSASMSQRLSHLPTTSNLTGQFSTWIGRRVEILTPHCPAKRNTWEIVAHCGECRHCNSTTGPLGDTPTISRHVSHSDRGR